MILKVSLFSLYVLNTANAHFLLIKELRIKKYSFIVKGNMLYV